MRCSRRLSSGAVVVVAPAAAVLLLPLGGDAALLALLLLHEQVEQQNLLLVDLQADVFGDVWDEPVHDVTHQHHHVLQGPSWKTGVCNE